MMVSTQFGKKDLKLMEETFSTLNGRILDIGCGRMLDRVDISGVDYIGVDIVKSQYASVIADIHELPFSDSSFDNCICNAVLEHVPEPEIALKEIHRVLKPGGLLWVSVPFLQHIHSAYDYRRFTGQGLIQLVNKCSFTIERLQGSYGALDNIEYLLYSAIGWKVVKEKDYKNPAAMLYIGTLIMLFYFIKVFAIIFSSQQERDIHHATGFSVIAKKMQTQNNIAETF